MKNLCGLRRLVALLLLVVVWLLASPQSVGAHPLDEYLQATYLTVAPAQIAVELDLTPGVLIAPQLLPLLDTDGDGQITDAEGRAYADSVLREVTLQVDGRPLPLAVARVETPPYLNVQAGYGLMRVFAAAALPDGMTGTHAVAYANTHAPAKSVYQVNTFVDKGAAITLGKQNRDETQQHLAVNYAIGGGAPDAATAATAATTNGTANATAPNTTPADTTAGARRLLTYLDAPALSLPQLLLALALAVLLGGLHALTPGHGKTLVAAYLVGSRGTTRHAVALGGIVTVTHTASVIAVGLLALFASRFAVPGVLVPVLEILSGLLVVALGVRLVRQRWAAFGGRRGAGARAHANGLLHDHGDGRLHSHLPPANLTPGGVVAMGVSGGLLPCPEALAIMILAVGLNRVALGLGLVAAFSFGLAAVLIALGVLLVRSRSLLARFGTRGGRWSEILPLVSAGIVTALGVGIAAKGLSAVRPLPEFGGYLAAFVGGVVVAALAGRLVAVFTRPQAATFAAATAVPGTAQTWLPSRYRDGRAVSDAPMSAAPLVYDGEGAVAWDRLWGHDDPEHPFCDLALAGGPPHRGSLLGAPPAEAVAADPARAERVRAEIGRGLRMVTGLATVPEAAPGWIGLACDSDEMAAWLATAITAENVAARSAGATLFLPAGPTFRTEEEVKNVVTAAAKTHHYWAEHRLD